MDFQFWLIIWIGVLLLTSAVLFRDRLFRLLQRPETGGPLRPAPTG